MMKTLSTTTFCRWLQKLAGLAAVLAALAMLLPVERASGLPGSAGDQPGLAQRPTVSDCEMQLGQVTPYLQQESPPYAGLILWHNESQGYSLCHPAGWHPSAADQATVIFTPDKPRQGVRFYIQVMDTPSVMTKDDLRWRANWFDILINALPNADVSWQARWHTGNLNSFEATYAYSDEEILYLRWVRLLYVGAHQYWLVAEAPAIANSTSLQVMLDALMLTFRPDDQVLWHEQ
jgi:hypothetical protein